MRIFFKLLFYQLLDMKVIITPLVWRKIIVLLN